MTTIDLSRRRLSSTSRLWSSLDVPLPILLAIDRELDLDLFLVGDARLCRDRPGMKFINKWIPEEDTQDQNLGRKLAPIWI